MTQGRQTFHEHYNPGRAKRKKPARRKLTRQFASVYMHNRYKDRQGIRYAMVGLSS